MMHSTAVTLLSQIAADARRGVLITPTTLTQEHISVALLVFAPALESHSLRLMLAVAGDHLEAGITGGPAVATACHIVNAMASSATL